MNLNPNHAVKGVSPHLALEHRSRSLPAERPVCSMSRSPTAHRKLLTMDQVRIAICVFNLRCSAIGQQKPLAIAAVGYSDGLRIFVHSGDGEVKVVGNEAEVDVSLSSRGSKNSEKGRWESGLYVSL